MVRSLGCWPARSAVRYLESGGELPNKPEGQLQPNTSQRANPKVKVGKDKESRLPQGAPKREMKLKPKKRANVRRRGRTCGLLKRDDDVGTTERERCMISTYIYKPTEARIYRYANARTHIDAHRGSTRFRSSDEEDEVDVSSSRAFDAFSHRASERRSRKSLRRKQTKEEVSRRGERWGRAPRLL